MTFWRDLECLCLAKNKVLPSLVRKNKSQILADWGCHSDPFSWLSQPHSGLGQANSQLGPQPTSFMLFKQDGLHGCGWQLANWPCHVFFLTVCVMCLCQSAHCLYYLVLAPFNWIASLFKLQLNQDQIKKIATRNKMFEIGKFYRDIPGSYDSRLHTDRHVGESRQKRTT